MKILVLSATIPATTTMPGSPRLFSLCKGLARSHQLTLASFAADQDRHRVFLNDPQSRGVFSDIVILPEPPPSNWWGRQVHRLRQNAHFTTRSRTPVYHQQIRRQLRDLLISGGFDILFVDLLPNAQYVLDADLPCPAVIDLHDCSTFLFSRKTQLEQRWPRKLLLYMETQSVRRDEASLARTFGAVILNSAVDEQFLKTVAPAARTLTIGNGVDTEYFSGNGAGDLTRLVFTGVMNYGPNEDAAAYFSHAILPLIRARCPDVTFTVVGKDPPPLLRAMHGQGGVRIIGEVPDVRPYVKEAGIFVCPLRLGAGVKNKLLAAMAMGRPVVASPLSIEGLDLVHEEHLLVGRTPEEFAAQVCRLMEDPALANRLAQAGKERVTRAYSWPRSVEVLEGTLQDLVGPKVSRARSARVSA